eukprot:211455-Chlamydomonas_euryale.AAC.1
MHIRCSCASITPAGPGMSHIYWIPVPHLVDHHSPCWPSTGSSSGMACTSTLCRPPATPHSA